MAKKKPEPKQFNYAVGQYWEGNHGSVGCYATYNSEVKYGTIEDAKNYKAYCIEQAIKNKQPKDYKIFMLVEIPE